MSGKSVGDLIAIARVGGGFDLSIKDHTPEEWAAVANKLVNGAKLTLRDAADLDIKDLMAIAQSGPPGSVIFVF